MNNIKMFEAQYKSTYSYFYKKARPKKKLLTENSLSFDKTLMHCFHETFYLTSYTEKSVLFQQAIERLELNNKDGAQKQILGIFNFHGWLLSQVQRTSYRQYVQKKYSSGKLNKEAEI